MSEQDLERTPIEVVEATEVRNQLAGTRRELTQAVGQLASFKAQVREDVIKHVKAGTICRPGANEQLEDWGLESWYPRYAARLTLEVLIQGIEIEDPSDVSYNISDYFEIRAENSDHELIVTYTNVQSVDEENS